VQEFTSPNSITDGFAELLKRNGIPHYRFHDLRHYAVSTMLLLNIPKKYIADYVGHETEHMIDTVYGHIMRDKKDDLMDVVNAHFCDFSAQMQNEMQNE
jgi:integrase